MLEIVLTDILFPILNTFSSYRFSWDRIQHLCQLRRRYIQLYASFLQQLCEVDVFEMREIEKDLDSKVILLWRYAALSLSIFSW